MKFYQQWMGGRFDPEGKTAYPQFPVAVPGNIQYEYAQSIGIENLDRLFYANTVAKLEETEGYTWEYRTNVTFDKKEGQKVFLVAEGVDYYFDVLLDGKKIFYQEGMYKKVELDLTDSVKPGSLVQFIIHPHPKRPGPYDSYRQAADRSAKPPVCYGWDWNPRLLISGLWQPCYIETREDDFISSCEPFYTLNEDRTVASVRFETECNAEVTYTLCDREGNVVYKGTEPTFTVKNVNLWWCVGEGEPYLYTWTAETKSDKKSGRIGFRTLRLVQNGGGAAAEPQLFPKPRYAAFITMELNGRRIMGKGSNWVNPEVFFGRITEERYRELLTAAKDANMNLLRLWGGAGMNKPAFYDICDELGLLIWQEFMLACNNYVGTPELLKVMEQEGTAVIKALRSHVCIALWCGGNELFNNWSGMDEQSHVIRLLNKLCYELDFQRPFMMTSPSTGMAHGGYLFKDLDCGEDVLQFFAHQHYTAYTEFGVPSLNPVEQLKKVIPEDELFPIKPTEAWVTHHAFGAWGDNQWACLPTIEGYFGEQKSLEETVAHSEWLQCSGYQAIFEEARRQWPYCSMVVNWCFEEPWVCAANNSLISYPMEIKPGYYSVKNALRPVIASARIPHFDWTGEDDFSAEIWYLNDSNEAESDEVTITLRCGSWEKELLTWKPKDVEGKTNLQGPTVHCKLPEASDSDALELILLSKKSGRSNAYKVHYNSLIKQAPTGQLNV